MSNTVIVVENSGEVFVAKFNGQPYVFEKGSSVPIALDAARHIFGFGINDKSEVFARHGWIQRSTDYEEGMKRLGQFSFRVGTVKIVSEAPELEVQEQESAEEAIEADDEDVKGQGSAPLQPGAGGGAKATDGVEAKPPAPTQQPPGMMTDAIFPA